MDNLGDSVGKKIVDALKFQEEEEAKITNIEAVMTAPGEKAINSMFENNISVETTPTPDLSSSNVSDVFQQNLNQAGIYSQPVDFEYPANVAILNNLISKLPVGVSKQTGALIIRQTMEALGIPMSSVIQEAKQVQETLTHKAGECQQNIINYKKQINILEMQSMQFQRQAVSMNDIISLFNN